MTPALKTASIPVIAALLALAAGLLVFLSYPVLAQSNATAPSNLSAQLVDGGALLSWDAPTENASSVTGYEILRRKLNKNEETLSSLVSDTGSTATTYTDASANEEGVRYTYRVMAIRGSVRSAWSNYATVLLAGPEPTPTPTATPTPEPTPDPADLAPNGLSVSLVDNRVTLSWTAPAEDAGSVTGYEVLRRKPFDDESTLATLVPDTESTATTYTDATATEAGKRYTYRVKALRSSQTSDQSNYAYIDLPADYAAPSEEASLTPTQENQRLTPPTGLTPATLENTLLGYSESEGARTLEPTEVTIEDVSFQVTTVGAGPGVPGLALTLTAGTSAADAALAGTDFILEADEYVLILDTTEFSFDDASLGHSDTTDTNDEYTGVVTAAWTEGEPALTAGETVAFRLERRDRPETPQFTHVTTPTVLVKNTGQTDNSLIAISSTTTKLAQGFQTGYNPAGYTLSSIGISFDSIINTLTAGNQLVATLNEQSSGSPGDVICDLDDPGSFCASGVHTFTAPSGGCPVLDEDTEYFVVLERVSATTDSIQVDLTNSKSEDAERAANRSIRGIRRTFTTGSWSTAITTNVQMIEVKGFVISSPATGAPSIQGVLQKDETLTADTFGIGDPDSFSLDDFTYQWIQVDGMTESDIGTNSESYTLVADDVGNRIKLKVSFPDGAGHSESVISAATPVIVAENGTRRLIWLGTMTVGQHGGNRYGFIADPGIGALSPVAFSHGSNTYTFVEIRIFSEFLSAEFSPALPDPNIAKVWHVTPDTGANVGHFAVKPEEVIQESQSTTLAGQIYHPAISRYTTSWTDGAE